MSARTTRGRSGGCPSRRSDIARTIPRTASADATKLNASSVSRLAGFEDREEQAGQRRDEQLDQARRRPHRRVRLRDAGSADQDRQGAEVRTVEEGVDALHGERDHQHLDDGQYAEQVRDRDRPDQDRVDQVRGHHRPAPVPAIRERTGEQPGQQVRR